MSLWKGKRTGFSLLEVIIALSILVLSLMGRGTTVEKAYLILLDTMLLIYFIPYNYLFLS